MATFARQLKGSAFDEGLVDVFGPAETTTGRARKNYGVNWALRSDLLLNLSPVALVDAVADVILREHREAIRAGVRADTGAPHPPLKRRGNTGDKLRKPIRGFRTGRFADTITRGKISESGPRYNPTTGRVSGPKLSTRRGKLRPFATRARTSIGAVSHGGPRDTNGNSGDYVAFVSEELDRGVDYFHVKGRVAEAIGALLADYMDGVMAGQVPAPSRGDVSAKDV